MQRSRLDRIARFKTVGGTASVNATLTNRKGT